MTDNNFFKNLNKENQEIAIENISIDELEMSLRVFNELKNKGINTLGEIISHTEDFFGPKNFPYIGHKGTEEITDLVRKNNLSFKKNNL